MLVRRCALQAAGGMAAVRDHLIDDCALGRLLKRQGPIWLGLTHRARSLRVFRSLGEIRAMISRSAYAQLRYSPWLLLGTVLAIAVTCVAPPLLVAVTSGAARWLAARRLGADGAGTAADASLLRPVALVGGGDAGHRGRLSRLHAGLGAAALARPGRHVEGTRAPSGAGRAIMGAVGAARRTRGFGIYFRAWLPEAGPAVPDRGRAWRLSCLTLVLCPSVDGAGNA